MRKNICITILIILINYNNIYSQYNYDGQINIPSAQLWSFMRYNNTKNHMYTGTIKESIPVYIYSDQDFTVPISIDYSSNGYMPNIQASQVGLGWFLNTGGSITRNVEGIPDDRNENARNWGQTSTPTDVYGYYYYHMLSSPASYKSSEGNWFLEWNCGRSVPTYHNSDMSKAWEYLPDIFSFNFMGYSGKFIMGKEQKIHVYATNGPSGEYKIDLSGFISNNKKSIITIKTGDGYTYKFGGTDNLKGIDQVTYLNPISCFDINTVQYHWPLTEIIAPNGRKVIFNYKLGSSTNAKPYISGKKKVVQRNYNIPPVEIEGEAEIPRHSTLVAYLESITIDSNAKIVFTYNDSRSSEKVKPYETVMDLATLPKLESINIYNSQNNLHKKMSLTHSYASNLGNPVMFLKSVKFNNNEEYKMDYYDETSSFPYHGSVNVDHWGYYNGGVKEFINLDLNNVDLDNIASVEYLFHQEKQGTDASRLGLLKKIVYPTKGYSVFEYEQHDYSWFVKDHYQYTDNKCQIYPKKINDIRIKAGGFRLKKITDYSSDSKYSSRQYTYKLNNNSSGILSYIPKYYDSYRYEIISESDAQTVRVFDFSYPGKTTFRLEECHICYENVQEIYDDGSKADYLYNYSENDPITFTYINAIRAHESVLQPYIPLVSGLSKGMLNGNLLMKTLYDKDKKKVYLHTYTYDTGKVLTYDISSYIRHKKLSENPIYWEYKMIIDDCPLLNETETYFSDNREVSTKTKYAYNSLRQLISTEKTNSEGTTISNENYFVTDVQNKKDIDLYMLDNFIIKSPIKTAVKLKKISDNQYKYIDYKESRFSKRIRNGNNDVDLISVKSVRINPNNWTPDYNLIDKEINYKYNNAKRVVQMTDKSNKITMYLWGYNGQYLIAEIKIADLYMVESAIKSVFSVSSIDDLSALISPDEIKLKDGSLQRALPNALVTTYTYQPLVGLLTVTDPSAITTYYDYDASGKLKRTYIKEANSSGVAIEKTISSYDYNYGNK